LRRPFAALKRGANEHRAYGTSVIIRPCFPTLKRGANEHCAYGAAGLTNIAPFHFARGRLYGAVECEPLSTT